MAAPTTTIINDPTGVASFSAAEITTQTVGTTNVESTFFFLRSGGAIQADYIVGANGSLTAFDLVAIQPSGATQVTYYGSEAANPFFIASGLTPQNPGYLSTTYSYAAGGALQSIVGTSANGKTFSSLG